MKRFFSILLIFVLLISSSCAESWSLLGIAYDAAASVYGAKKLNEGVSKKISIYSENDSILVDFGGHDIILINENGKTVSASVRLKKDEASMDFVLSCMSIISTLGEVDTQAFGMLLMQFIRAKSGGENTPYPVTKDFFSISTSEKKELICVFTYINNEFSRTGF